MKQDRATTQKNLQRPQKSSILVLGLLFMLLISYSAKTQTLEAGPFLGASYYLGDLNPSKHFIESNLAYGGVIKYNLNQRWAIGLAATRANIKSDNTTYNLEHTAQVPPLATTITELALLGEVNFFPYAIGDRKNYWTPYIFGGGAAYMSQSATAVSISTPFGLGVKVSVFKTIGLNLFWSARKTFTDELDNVVSINYDGYNSDWYSFYGLNITFAFRIKKDGSCRNLINGRYY